MFAGFNKHNHAGLLSGVPARPVGPSSKVGNRFDPKPFLPASASEVLDTTDLPPQKDQKLAAAVANYFGTADVAAATKAEALAQYLDQLASNLDAKAGKDVGDLTRFLSGLRVWVFMNEIYQLAANDFDSDAQTSAVKGFADEMQRLLTDSKDKQLAADIVNLYTAAKKAQTDLMKVQVSGVCEIPIYEWHGPGKTETTYCQWIGGVALRPEVKSDKGAWPIPPCASPTMTTIGAVNPIFRGNIPGLADYLPFNAVGPSGVAIDSLPLDKRYPKIDQNLLKKIVEDQARRLSAKNTLAAEGVKDWLGRCINQDPEFNPKTSWADWAKAFGNIYVKINTLGLYDLDSFSSKTGKLKEASKKALPAIAALQETYRNSKPVQDAQAKVAQTLNAIRGTVVAVCNQVPPVPIKRAFNSKAGLILPYRDWNAWREDVKGVPAKTMQNQIKGYGWWQDKPDIVNTILSSLQAFYPDSSPVRFTPEAMLLQNWEPGMPSPWPTKPPLGFDLKALPSVASAARKDATALLAKLAGTQQEWAKQRGSVKASLLLASKLSELGKKSQGATDAMVETLSYLGELLYGCSVPDAPSGLTGKALLDYYNAKLVECAKNPTPDSLMGQLNAKLAQYEKTKDPALKQEIDALSEKIGTVASRRGSRRGKVMSNTTDSGGTLSLTQQSDQTLKNAPPAPKVKLPDGTTVNAGATGTEQNVGQKTAQDNKDTTDKVKSTLGYVDGSGGALGVVNEKVPGALPPALVDQVNENKKNAEDIVDPAKAKKGSPWALLLGVGAVVAAMRNK